MFFIKMIGALTQLGITYFISSNLGAKALGAYGIALTVIAMVSLVARYGTDKNILKEISVLIKKKKSSQLSTFLFSYITFLILITFIFSVALFLLGPFVNNFFNIGDAEIFKIGAFAVFSTSIVTAVSAIYLCDEKYALSSGYQFTFHQIILSLILVSFISSINNATHLLAAYFVSSFLVGIWGVLDVCRRYINFQRVHKDLKEIFTTSLSFFQRSGNLFRANASGMMTGWLDILLIGYFLDAASVGIYLVAQRISHGISMILTPINSYATPLIAQYSESRNFSEMLKVMSLARKMGATVVIFILAPIFIFGDMILSFFGEGFELGYWVLVILCLAQLVNSIAGPTVQQISVFDSESQIKYASIMQWCLFICIILHIFLIPLLGINGAAIATSLSSIMSVSLSFFYMQKRVSSAINKLN